jgi:rare lipoprotein A
MRSSARCKPVSALAGLALTLLAAGCAPSPRRPSPPAPQVVRPAPITADVTSVPDAIPRPEPRSALGNPPFYSVGGHRYVVLPSADGYIERGVASWYGTDFHGLRTATGESYDMFAMTAAHKTLPLPCYARVTNLANGRSVVVRINDRGPFVSNRIIDLSYTAASRLDMIRNGTAFVQVEALTAAVTPLTTQLPATTPAASAASVGVSSVPAITAPLASAPPTPMSRYYIQVGAYAQAENAHRTEQALRGAGLEHVFVLGATSTAPLQRVRIGPIDNVQQFDQLIERLSALGFTDARLAQD